MLINQIRSLRVPTVELAVYRDPGYPSSWIKEEMGSPDAITSFLIKRKCRKLDAEQLRDFMLNAIDKDTAPEKLVIFSQDVVPETVVEEFYNSTTLRIYLNAGGSVLWLGDSPLYYIGSKGKDKGLETWRDDVLDINPVFLIPKTRVNFTPHGEAIGLKRPWAGIRPILSGKKIKVLAETKDALAQYYVNSRGFITKKMESSLENDSPEGKVIVQGLRPRSSNQGLGCKGSQRDKDIDPPIVHGTSVNAWVKKFSDAYPQCGFFRIWDYIPGSFNNTMLNDLFSVIRSIDQRLHYPWRYLA